MARRGGTVGSPTTVPMPAGVIIAADLARATDHCAFAAAQVSSVDVRVANPATGEPLPRPVTMSRLRLRKLDSSQLWGADDWRASWSEIRGRFVAFCASCPLDRLLWIVIDSSGVGDSALPEIAQRLAVDLGIDVRSKLRAAVMSRTGQPGALVGGSPDRPAAWATHRFAGPGGVQREIRWQRRLAPRAAVLEAARAMSEPAGIDKVRRLSLHPQLDPAAREILLAELRSLPAPEHGRTGLKVAAPDNGGFDDCAVSLGLLALAADAATMDATHQRLRAHRPSIMAAADPAGLRYRRATQRWKPQGRP